MQKTEVKNAYQKPTEFTVKTTTNDFVEVSEIITKNKRTRYKNFKVKRSQNKN